MTNIFYKLIIGIAVVSITGVIAALLSIFRHNCRTSKFKWRKRNVISYWHCLGSWFYFVVEYSPNEPPKEVVEPTCDFDNHFPDFEI